MGPCEDNLAKLEQIVMRLLETVPFKRLAAPR
jgi:hypothetical protein